MTFPYLTRRDFAKAACAASAAPLLMGSLAMPAASVAAPDMADLLADALTDYIRARYESRLSREQLAQVRNAILGNPQAAEQLRTFPLPVTVEPMWTLGASRLAEG